MCLCFIEAEWKSACSRKSEITAGREPKGTQSPADADRGRKTALSAFRSSWNVDGEEPRSNDNCITLYLSERRILTESV